MTFQYDAFGNLKRVDLPNGDVVQYLVDGMNRRIGKMKNGSIWITKDPILFGSGQANLYVYVGNDPINRLDPSGRIAGVDDAVLIGGAAIVVAGAAIYGILASNPHAVNDTINWIEDTVTPKPAPTTPDCALARTQCAQGCLPELETDKDCGGNNGFQKGIELCLRALGC
jgi:RHS repeat-associated protein